ncbi:hypothetical protein KGF56_000048 [Candida oxycetoniae]|uniref:BAG domain-containing protein n=1 Tax=Candida oxycetoniae TaxID=497107 RepID=A0AAI9T1H0_9ASCO|nr:uncharacterized protein KGF56_000048 [Candida oxycetoniae]KAI3407146.2 hypothetical protein KGF56_000048 [Candida oxycetoniae]
MDQLKSAIPIAKDEVYHYIELLKQKIQLSFAELQPYIDYTKSMTAEEILDDFKNLKVNPITVSLTLFSLTTIFIIGRLLGNPSSSSLNGTGTKSGHSEHDEKKHKKKSSSGKKKLSKAQKANREIQDILDFVESKYVPEIDKYIEDYKSLTEDEAVNKFNFFQEMLLKETLKLDAIDVIGNEILRENRRKVIKFIQDHQKRLDKFRKDVAGANVITSA